MAATPYLALDPAVLEANLAAMAGACREAGVALRPHVKGPKSAWIARRQLEHGAVGVAAATLDEAAAMVDGGVGDVLLTSVLAPGKLADACSLAARAERLTLVVHTPDLVRALGAAAGAAGLSGPSGVRATQPRPGRGAGAAGLGGPSGVGLTQLRPGRGVGAAGGPSEDGGRPDVGEAPARAAPGGRLGVLVDVDVGQRRGGAAPGAARAVADTVAAEAALVLAGVQGYEGHLQAIADAGARAAASTAAMDVLAGLVGELRAAGHAVPWVTTGGTGTALLAARHPVVSEVQPGSYALMDHAYAAVGGVTFGQAVHVVTAVTAVLGPGEVVVDAGLKALGTDAGVPVPVGVAATYAWAGDEHGRLTGELAHLAPGDLVRLIPAHADTTVDRHAAYVLPDGTELRVTARSA